MDNETEILARWLGWREHPICKGRYAHPTNVQRFYVEVGGLPDFRASNEWAGALLERLFEYGFVLSCKEGKAYIWFGVEKDSKIVPNSRHGATWRDAVVEAALEIAKRESTAGRDTGNEAE